MREPRFIQLHQPDEAPVRAEVVAGLLALDAVVAPKFFYDALGSRLFDAITELDEYYPTRTEAAILAAHGSEIVSRVHTLLGPAPTMVDLGAGNCAKAASLFGRLQPARYVALDISADFLRGALHSLQRQYPTLDLVGVGLDFSARLALPPDLLQGPSLLFYPGSSIGNFSPHDALRLLRQAHELTQGGALLIGVDLDKPTDVLQAAYDDALGVTAAFNLNLLRHLNRVAGTNFCIADWQHVAHYHRAAGRIEMHLQARRAITVAWPGGERRFSAGERIHTENSYKWDRGAFESLLAEAGFRRVHRWADAQTWFAVMLAEAG